MESFIVLAGALVVALVVVLAGIAMGGQAIGIIAGGLMAFVFVILLARP